MIKSKIKYLHYSIIVVFFILIVMSCKEAKPIMPLKIGNAWVYKSEKGYVDTVKVIDTVMINNETIFVSSDRHSYLPKYWRIKKDTLYCSDYLPTGKLAKSFDWMLRFIVLPLKAGKTWKFWEDHEAEVMKREIVETDAGKFLCWKIIYKDAVEDNKGTYPWIVYYAPGVGFIKTSIKGIKEERNELIDYNVQQ